MDRMRDARRRFLARALGAAGTLLVAGCERLSQTEWFPKVLGAGEAASSAVAHAVTSRKSMAQEFTDADRSPTFRSNGTAEPDDDDYRALAAQRLRRLPAGGRRPRRAAGDACRWPNCARCPAGRRSRGTTASRAGARSRSGRARGSPRCSRRFSRSRKRASSCSTAPIRWTRTAPSPYYESIDLEDAFHPQTILAYEMNDAALPIANGAPIRLRVERQLGYKHAKYVMRIELVESFATIAGGKGGYWEDQGYQWFAGI